LNAAWSSVLSISGGSLTGALTLNADPSVALGAATKQYVDSRPPAAGSVRYDVSQSLSSGQKTQAQNNMGLTATPILRNFFAGLRPSTAGGSSSISFGAGMASDSTNVDYISLAAAITKTTAVWAAGSGNGGLDTGTIANNTSYHFFAIKRVDTGQVDLTFSLSPTTPALPSPYTLFRRVWSLRTDASGHWVAFIAIGDYCSLVNPVLDVNVNPGTTATVARAIGSIPTGVSMVARLAAYCQDVELNTPTALGSVFPVDANPPPVNNFGAIASVAGSGFSVTLGGTAQIDVKTDTNAQVNTAMGSASANVLLRLVALGYTDIRGRDL
jgi:hypothetical protein